MERELIKEKKHLESKYDALEYRCTYNTPNGERLEITAQIPDSLEEADNPSTFGDFEDFILSFDSIISLELVMRVLKRTLRATSQRVELCCFKQVHRTEVLVLKILEVCGERIQIVMPTYPSGFLSVTQDNTWEWYNEIGMHMSSADPHNDEEFYRMYAKISTAMCSLYFR